MHLNWRGPFRVVAQDDEDPDRYTVQNLITNNFPTAQMKLFVEDEVSTSAGSSDNEPVPAGGDGKGEKGKKMKGHEGKGEVGKSMKGNDGKGEEGKNMKGTDGKGEGSKGSRLASPRAC